MTRGTRIVLTSPLTEMIDHAGYFIQMGMASMPLWMEGAMNRKYPAWKAVKRLADGSAMKAPAGLRVLEQVLVREFGRDNVVVCYPDDLDHFVGVDTRAVAVSTMNPLGTTFAAGVYTSIFGSSREPINAHYARRMFQALREHPRRTHFKVIVGGAGGWQITQTGSAPELGVDCVVDGRSESSETVELFRRAVEGKPIPRSVTATHPREAASLLYPERPTTFGVVEMTTGCGRRCHFCVPDLNPQIAIPKDTIMKAVKANVANGNPQVSLSSEDMFIWGQVKTTTPFFFPNREALIDLYSEVVMTPGVSQHVLLHATMAPAVIDPTLIRQLSNILLEKSPIHLPRVSSHREGKSLVPLIGLETGSPRMAKQLMPGKAAPFKIDDWPSVIIRGMEILNASNWFPMLTIMVGSPGEDDEDVRATLDLVYEMERRRLFGFLVPSVYTPLEGTRMQNARGVTTSRALSPLQWQLIMACWRQNLRPGLRAWWGPTVFKLGAFILWLTRLRKTNGPNFTWPLLMFAGVPRWVAVEFGKLHRGRPLTIKTRNELLRSIHPRYWPFLRADNGDVPTDKPEQTVADEMKIEGAPVFVLTPHRD
jgi:radical SAM superfamily enzyme YgiQ (UPF0313 family)